MAAGTLHHKRRQRGKKNKKAKDSDATTWDRTRDLSVNSRPLCQRSSGGLRMNPEGFEPPTFGSGIRRAAVAPWARDIAESGLCSG